VKPAEQPPFPTDHAERPQVGQVALLGVDLTSNGLAGH
jgi:hypothetical protein